uniref:Evasin n=1 Tax=Ixodes ricinus TaxID=34613 RepID=A0A0K8R3G9_IXORI
MMLLKLTLVIIISEIGERTMCSAPSTKENESAPVTFPPKSLLNATTSNGCKHSEVPYFEDEGPGFPGGFLAVSCTKDCPSGKEENVAEGYRCVATVNSLHEEEADVTVGTCVKGTCQPDKPPRHRTVQLITEEEEEEVEEEDEEEGEDDEEEVEEE